MPVMTIPAAGVVFVDPSAGLRDLPVDERLVVTRDGAERRPSRHPPEAGAADRAVVVRLARRRGLGQADPKELGVDAVTDLHAQVESAISKADRPPRALRAGLRPAMIRASRDSR